MADGWIPKQSKKQAEMKKTVKELNEERKKAKKEKLIEQSCIREARRRGWNCWKNENNGNKGIPDYSLLSPDGRFVMVEFKRSAAAHIRPEQLTWQAKHPGIVFFCHDLETFKKILEPRRIVCGDCVRILDECAGFHNKTDETCVRFKLNMQQ